MHKIFKVAIIKHKNTKMLIFQKLTLEKSRRELILAVKLAALSCNTDSQMAITWSEHRGYQLFFNSKNRKTFVFQLFLDIKFTFHGPPLTRICVMLFCHFCDPQEQILSVALFWQGKNYS